MIKKGKGQIENIAPLFLKLIKNWVLHFLIVLQINTYLAINTI